jgi:tetratricopeptide (TPR) repeat protein
MRRPVLYTLLLLLLIAASAIGGEDAGRETPFSLGAGARSLAMGGGFSALADDASATYYNPAGLVRLQYQELTFMHATLFADTRYNFGAWAIPVSRRAGVGVAYMRIGTDGIVGREDFVVTDTMDYAHSQVVFSFGHELYAGLAAGVSFKVVNQSLGRLSDYAYGADVGLGVKFSEHFFAGVIARDLLAPKLELEAMAETTPWTLSGGLAVSGLALSDFIKLAASFDLEKPEDRSVKLHAGGEVLLHEAAALRLGYDRDNVAFGAGIKAGRFRIDYAYKLLDYVDNSHRFSLTLLLDAPSRREEVPVEPTVPVEVPDERRLRFEELKGTGDRFLRQMEFDSALVYFRRALAYDETDQEIIDAIASIEKARQVDEDRQAKLAEAEEGLRGFVDRYYEQAALFYGKKYYPAALDLLALVFETDPTHQRALALREEIDDAKAAEISRLIRQAETATEQGRIIEAIEAYNRILDLEPDNQPALQAKAEALAGLDLPQQLNLGIRLYTMGRYEASKGRFRSVLASNPYEPVALEYLKKIETAQAEVSTLEDLQRDRVIWNLYLEGIRHMRNQDYQQAIEAWEQVLEAYPNNANTLDNLEQARLRLQSEQSE